MMNSKNKRSILLIFTSLFLLNSCKNDFLNVIPKGKQIAEKTSDYALLMNSTSFYQYLQGGGWQPIILMGDELGAEQSFFNSAPTQIQRLFRWDPIIYDKVTDVAQDLRNFLPNIYTCNLVINEVLSSSEGTEQEKKALQAEAMATRAWVYFQLINFYAKPYSAATAGSDPGFPLIKKPDVVENNYVRGTVQEAYDFIISDLVSAIPNLPLENIVRTRMSKAAAEGLLGKVYLFMGKSDQGLTALNAALSHNAAATVPARLYDYNVTMGPAGSFLPISTQTGPASPGNIYNDFTEAVLAKTFSNPYAFGNNGIVITPETAELYGAADLRLKFYTNKYNNGSDIPGGRLRKYGVSFSKFGVELSDLYLLRAECKARLGDLTGAVADLETLRQKRMPVLLAGVPGTVAADKTLMVKFIIDERIREFAAEGHRWFDMRRLSIDPLFSGMVFLHKIYPASGVPVVHTLNQPNRLVLKLPPNILIANPGMNDNP